MSFFGGGSSAAPASTASVDSAKTRIVSQIQQESAVTNAKALIAKVNENCFASCIPSPGSSLSSKEQTCLSSCMEKYIEGWNLVSQTYIKRIGAEQAKLANAKGGAGFL